MKERKIGTTGEINSKKIQIQGSISEKKVLLKKKNIN